MAPRERSDSGELSSDFHTLKKRVKPRDPADIPVIFSSEMEQAAVAQSELLTLFGTLDEAFRVKIIQAIQELELPEDMKEEEKNLKRLELAKALIAENAK